jgi:cytochrome c553
MASRIIRRVLTGLFVLVLIVVAAIGVIYLLSSRRLNHVYAVTPVSLTIPDDSTTLERGRHLATARLGCTDCHGSDLGGSIVVDGMPFGRFVGSNLTTGGVGRSYTDADWVRAIRDGVRPDGRALTFMPSQVFALLSAEDLAATIAYVKSAPPVTRSLPGTAVGPIGRMLIVFNKAALIPAEVIDHSAAPPAAPWPGATPEYGQYLVSTSGCAECHGKGLSGGKINGGPDDPPAQNITPTGIGSWSEADFIRALREGTRPDGTRINTFMPWQSMGKMSDEELLSIYRYLRTVPPKPYGQG